MEENERYLVAVHDLEEALNDLHNSVLGHNQNENLTDDPINNILDDLRSATDRFTIRYAKIYPTLQTEAQTQTEAHGGHPDNGGHPVNSTFFPKKSADKELQTKSMLSKLNRIQLKNRKLALERIEASIKKNMRRL